MQVLISSSQIQQGLGLSFQVLNSQPTMISKNKISSKFWISNEYYRFCSSKKSNHFVITVAYSVCMVLGSFRLIFLISA